MEIKQFFKTPSLAEISKYKNHREISENLIENLLNINPDEAIIIRKDLIPSKYPNAKKFKKHGIEIIIPRYESLEQAVKIKKTPVQLRERVFNKIKNKAYCGYSFKPFTGTDKRTRNVFLDDCLEGAKICAYTKQDIKFKPLINVKVYDDAGRVQKDGAEAIIKVPSRIKNQSNYEFKFSSIPVIDSPEKWGISYNIMTTHNCKDKLFNIRYNYLHDKENSRQFNFCAHEIAAYLEIIDYYWNNKKNIIPLQMNQFAIPTQYAVNFYNILCRNTLIQTSKDKNPRKLNKVEKEILLWGLVHKKGHDKTFFARDKIKNYDWGFKKAVL